MEAVSVTQADTNLSGLHLGLCHQPLCRVRVPDDAGGDTG